MIKLSSVKTNKKRVATILRRNIYFGEFKPGQELVQNTIATQLGVSRMPVRDALNVLQSEGLVEYIPNRGFFVKDIGRTFFEDYYSIRSLFEQKAIGQLCQAWTDSSELKEWGTLLQKAYESRNLSQLGLCSDWFNDYLGKNCGSPRLAAYLRQLYNMSPRRISNDDQKREQYIIDNYHFHQAELTAILQRDINGACNLIKSQIERTKNYYFSIRDELHLDD